MAPNYSQPRVDPVEKRFTSYAVGENDTASYQVPTTLSKHSYPEIRTSNIWRENEENDYFPTSHHDLTSKNSRASLASTSRRSSAAPSIFSTAGLRISTASTVYSRYSVRQHSLDSADPMSSATPWGSERCDDGYNTDDYPLRYCCTFCDAMFACPVHWRDHELKDHDRPEEHMCSICNDTFPEGPSLAFHRRYVHSLSSPQTTEHMVKLPTRGAWGCGFCGAFAESRHDYLDHVGRHCEEGMQRVHWQHSSVIRGLLKQPKIAEAWNRLVSNQEQERGTKLHFTWDEQATGRQATTEVDACNPSRLQDVLEFFSNNSSDPQSIVQNVFDVAQIRTEQKVSSHVKAYYPTSLRPLSESPDDIALFLVDGMGRLTVGPPQIDEGYPDNPFPCDSCLIPVSSTRAVSIATFPDQTTAAESLFAGWNPYAHAQPNSSQTREKDIAPHRTSQPSTTESTSLIVPKTNVVSQLKPTSTPLGKGLRRIDSDRHLHALKPGAVALPRGEDIERPRTALAADYAGVGTSVSAEHDVEATQQPSLSDALLELDPRNSVVRKDWLLVPKGSRSSVGSPSVSSMHSGNARNRLLTLDDSTSERVSEDSLSDPDLFAEHDISNDSSRAWRKAYQQAINLVLQRLWSQYNENWEALIRSCVGSVGSSNADRMDPYRAGKATPSRRRPGGTLRPPSSRRTPDDDDDEEDDDGSQPSPYPSRPGSAASKRFACPFRKHNPEKYNRVDYDICANKDWPTIPRLKEHLYRRHYKIHCQRCKQTFSDARQLTIHEMAPEACELLDIKPPGDITTSQERQLKSRKHTHRRQSDEEKWREIYRLLFPNDIMPSPYPEYAEDFQPMGTESRNVLEFQHYLLTEMPRLFTQAAYEYAGQHIQDQVLLRVDDVNKIIEDTLQQAYDTWTLQGRLLPPNISPSISMREFPAAPAPPAGHLTSMPSTTWSETPMPPPPYMQEQSASSFLPNTSAPEYALFPIASDMEAMLTLDDIDIPVSNPAGSAPSYTSSYTNNEYMTTGPDVQYTGAGFCPYNGNPGGNPNWF